MSARANQVTEAYLAECATPDSRLRGALAELDVSETMRAAWPRLLPRPVVVDEAEFRAFGRDLVTIFELVTSLPQRCRETDGPSAALLEDLAERGLLEDTLFVWGGEFGRTCMNEERDGSKFLGRDHHPHAFTILLAGGGLKQGITLGATDELGYRVVEDPVSVHDLHATLLALLGIDHLQLTFRSQGRDFRLTDVEGEVVKKLLA